MSDTQKVYKSRTVYGRLLQAFGVFVLISIVMGVIAVTSMVRLRNDYSDYVDDTYSRTMLSGVVAQYAAAVGSDLMATFFDPENSAQRSAALDADIATLSDAIEELEALELVTGSATPETGEEAGQDHLQVMKDALNVVVQEKDGLIALANTDGQLAMQEASEDLGPSLHLLTSEAEAYSKLQGQLAVAESDRLSEGATGLLTTVSIVAAIGVLIALAMQVYLLRTAPKLRGAIATLNVSAAEILAVASQVAAGAAQTASSTNETTATVEEVKQTAQLANDKASQVAENAEKASRIADTGRAAVDETIAGIERMQTQMGTVTHTITQLSDRTQAVGEIIATVSDLAEQSNLLSVNASIEAAKAGDQGKGFTVVAQEVKSLAEQSKQAVAQVRTILGEIQKAGDSAVQAAELGTEAVEAGRRQSQESGEAIQLLAESVSETSQSAVQISASSRQQLAGMEQISQAIDSINAAGTQSVTGTKQVEQEVKGLQDVASDLGRVFIWMKNGN